jgi:hypothetical protein
VLGPKELVIGAEAAAGSGLSGRETTLWSLAGVGQLPMTSPFFVKASCSQAGSEAASGSDNRIEGPKTACVYIHDAFKKAFAGPEYPSV